MVMVGEGSRSLSFISRRKSVGSASVGPRQTFWRPFRGSEFSSTLPDARPGVCQARDTLLPHAIVHIIGRFSLVISSLQIYSC